MAFITYFETCVCLNHKVVILCPFQGVESLTAKCTSELPCLRNEELVCRGSKVAAEAGGRAGIIPDTSRSHTAFGQSACQVFLGGGSCGMEMGIGKVWNGAVQAWSSA